MIDKNIKGLFVLLRCESLKLWRMTMSYPLNAVVGLGSIIVIAALGMFGISAVFEDTQYFYCLLFAPILTNSIASISNSYKFDTMIGAIDQVATSTFGLRRVFFARYCLDYVISVLPTVLLLVMGSFIMDITVNVLYSLLTIVLIFFSGYYIGLLLYGLVIVYKKIDSISGALNAIIIALAILISVIGVEKLDFWVYLVPFSSYMILPSLPFNAGFSNCLTFGLFLGNLTFSCLIAKISYAKLYDTARNLGTIGQY